MMTRQEILNRLRKIDECIGSTARNARDLGCCGENTDEWADREIRQLRNEQQQLKAALARS